MALAEVKSEFEGRVGELVHTSEWLEMTQERVNRFAQATDDHQWIHTDPPRAVAESPYEGTIAHGFLTLSMVTFLRGYLSEHATPFPGARSVINYGANKIRFPNAVRVGNRIRGRFELLAIDEVKGNGLQLTERCTIEIDGQDKPACVAEILMRAYF